MSTKTILVVSDTHGRLRELRMLLRSEKNADAMFFLGDGLFDLQRACELEGPCPYPVYPVRGNCDAGAPEPPEGLVPLGGVLFFYTHGHLYEAKSGPDTLAEAAANRGADVVLYGHTHRRKLLRPTDGLPVTLFNPGSLYSEGCYGVITVTEGQCSFTWKRVSV